MSKRGKLKIRYVSPYNQYSYGYAWTIQIGDIIIAKPYVYKSWHSANKAAQRAAKLFDITIPEKK